MPLYAVKLGDYVEFREAPSPPRARKSVLTRFVEEDQWTIKFVKGEEVGVKVKGKVKRKMSQIFYVGGDPVGVCRSHRYAVVAPAEFRFGRGGCVKVSTELKDKCLKGVG